MAKSKAIVNEKKQLNTECVEQLEGVLANAKAFAQNCVNPTTGIYFMQNIFRTFAYNYARWTHIHDLITEKLEEIKSAKSADYIRSLTFDIKRLKYQAESALDLKAFELCYQDALDIYESMLNNFVNDSNNDNIILSFKTGDEILAECFKSLEASEKNSTENDVEYLKAFLSM
jgi:hypothetical protein